MGDKRISFSVTSDLEEFIASQIASGNYADAQEVLCAGLAILRREATSKDLRGVTEKKNIVRSHDRQMGFNEPDERVEYRADDAAALRFELETSESSGASSRQIPDIIASVKAKLRANGSL